MVKIITIVILGILTLIGFGIYLVLSFTDLLDDMKTSEKVIMLIALIPAYWSLAIAMAIMLVGDILTREKKELNKKD